jgi:hypothetical protein
MLDELIAEADTFYRGVLDDARFRDAPRLLDEFERDAATWGKRRDAKSANGVQEKLNELAAGAALLSTMGEDETLSYEPPLLATKKTIDFRLNGTNGTAGWVDVKTVSPEWADTDEKWERFLQISADAPENVHIVRDKELGGAGISNQDLKTRWTFAQRTFALEEKIAAFETSEKAPTSMLFCTYGFAWTCSALEDFADFYRTGRFRADDGFSNAIARFMTDEGLAFDRSIAGFHYLERKQFSAFGHCFVPFVAGPAFGR